MGNITKINVAGQTYDIQDERITAELLNTLQSISKNTQKLVFMADISAADELSVLQSNCIYNVNGSALLIFSNSGASVGAMHQTLVQKGKILYRYNIKDATTTMDATYWSEWRENGVTQISWVEGCTLNSITTEGEYEITGSREKDWKDNMPIINSGGLHAKLSVFNRDNYISQCIRLDNISGGDYNIYMRVCQSGVWEDWQKLQTNIEVNAIGIGQSRTFDDFTDNGIYSGVNVYQVGTDDNGYPIISYETFVLIVINAYLTGGGVSQLKYSTLVDGTTTIKKRTKINQGGDWSDWTNVGGGNESIHISGAGTFSIDGDKYKTIFLASVGPETAYYNITATKSTIIDVVLFGDAANCLHFDVNGSGRYAVTESYKEGMYRLAIDMSSNTLIVSTISNDANKIKF